MTLYRGALALIATGPDKTLFSSPSPHLSLGEHISASDCRCNTNAVFRLAFGLSHKKVEQLLRTIYSLFGNSRIMSVHHSRQSTSLYDFFVKPKKEIEQPHVCKSACRFVPLAVVGRPLSLPTYDVMTYQLDERCTGIR